jgi:hypothetical protein
VVSMLCPVDIVKGEQVFFYTKAVIVTLEPVMKNLGQDMIAPGTLCYLIKTQLLHIVMQKKPMGFLFVA